MELISHWLIFNVITFYFFLVEAKLAVNTELS